VGSEKFIRKKKILVKIGAKPGRSAKKAERKREKQDQSRLNSRTRKATPRNQEVRREQGKKNTGTTAQAPQKGPDGRTIRKWVGRSSGERGTPRMQEKSKHESWTEAKNSQGGKRRLKAVQQPGDK